MADFCSINCLCTELSDTLAIDGQLPADLAARLEDEIPSGKYTRLVVSGSFGCEIIKVANKTAGVCITGRGEESTTPREWAKGSKIRFDWTTQNMADMYDCRVAAAATDAAALIKSDYFEVSVVDGVTCIEPKPNSGDKDVYGEFSFKAGLYRYFLKNGVWCRVPLDASEVTPDGVYENATATVKDNCATFAKGSNIVTNNSCGCCTKTAEDGVGV